MIIMPMPDDSDTELRGGRKGLPSWVPILVVALGFLIIWLIFFPDSRPYLGAVTNHWVVLMSGLVSVAITFYEKIRDSIGKYALYGIAGACIFFAGFQAWQDQHNLAESERTKNSKPDFFLQVPQMTTTREMPNPGYISVFAEVLIINRGADSVAVNWGAFLLKSDSTRQEVHIGRQIEPVRLQQGKFVLVINPANYIYDKTSGTPLVRGSMANGTLLMRVPTDEWSDITAHRTKLFITVQDYLADKFSADATPSGQHTEVNENTFTQFPGMTLEPAKKQ
jgi:hypothetical protein